MPELPDITVYIKALEKRILGQRVERVRIVSPFLLRTVEPPVASAEGREVVALRRLGKRICIGLEGEIWLVLHLMIEGEWQVCKAFWTAEFGGVRVFQWDAGLDGGGNAKARVIAPGDGRKRAAGIGSGRRRSARVRS